MKRFSQQIREFWGSKSRIRAQDFQDSHQICFQNCSLALLPSLLVTSVIFAKFCQSKKVVDICHFGARKFYTQRCVNFDDVWKLCKNSCCVLYMKLHKSTMSKNGGLPILQCRITTSQADWDEWVEWVRMGTWQRVRGRSPEEKALFLTSTSLWS